MLIDISPGKTSHLIQTLPLQKHRLEHMKSCGNCNVIDYMDTQSQIQLASFAGSIQGSL